MSWTRANSSSELHPPADEVKQLEGVSANVKLHIKLVQDPHEAQKEDDPHRDAGMVTILDDGKTHIEKTHQPQPKPKPKLLQRCNTEIRRTPPGTPPQRDRHRPHDPHEENQRLRREIASSIAAQRSLQKMFSSLGKEKEIIAAELARKVQELNGMEELVSDLKAQNEMLTEKVKACVTLHGGKVGGGEGREECEVLQERNQVLSEQLLRSLDGYRSMKRRLKDVQEEKMRLQSKVAETAVGIERMRGVCERVCREGGKEAGDVLVSMERMLVGFQAKLSKGSPRAAE